MNLTAYLACTDEVTSALAQGEPVVALESTIISHGMPYPENVAMARSVEALVRECGATPATIALLGGKVKIGLTPDELETLAAHPDVHKTSRRDMAYVLMKQIPGATTVAATMIAAARAGIRVFATGGIGGVHRGAEDSMDISADIMELAQTNVAVVSAGVKSILDIGRTLEMLETHGVPVVGYQSDAFPAFYTRDSGYPVDFRLDTPDEVAAMMKIKWDLQLNGGMIIANPVPLAHAMPAALIDEAIAKALAEADNLGIRGKAITPFLLAAIKDNTRGTSLATNIALVQHNARVAAEIAVAYAAL